MCRPVLRQRRAFRHLHNRSPRRPPRRRERPVRRPACSESRNERLLVSCKRTRGLRRNAIVHRGGPASSQRHVSDRAGEVADTIAFRVLPVADLPSVWRRSDHADLHPAARCRGPASPTGLLRCAGVGSALPSRTCNRKRQRTQGSCCNTGRTGQGRGVARGGRRPVQRGPRDGSLAGSGVRA